MAKHDDLKVFPAARAHGEACELGQEPVEGARRERQGS
jgi:hypothetical protein